MISSSSNPGQSNLGDSSKSSQGGQQHSASLGWSGSFSADEKLNSGNTWGIGPGSASLNSSVWSSSLSSVSSANNQGSSMQSSHSVIGDGSANPLASTAGWGVRNGAQDTNNAQSNGPHSTWQGLNLNSSISRQDSVASTSAADTSGYGTPNSTSVITSTSISSLDTKGASAIASSIWNSVGGNDGASSGWGSTDPPKPDSSTGWGSPNAMPLPNAGTEAWGQPDKSSTAAASTGWVQSASSQSATPGWGQSDTNQKLPTPSGWGEPSRTTSSNSSSSGGSGWGDPPPAPVSSASTGWGSQPASIDSKPTQTITPATPTSTMSSWGAPGSTKPSSSSTGWGSNTDTNANAASRPNNSSWGQSSALPPSSQQPPNAASATSSSSEWNASGQTSNQPRPIGSQQQPPPSQPSLQQPGTQQQSQQQLQPQQQQQRPPGQTPSQPSSWAEAAGRGLPPSQPSNTQPFRSRASREEMIARAVNTSEGWGKTPVRQDTNWDMEESPKLQRKSVSSTSSSNASHDSNTWNQPNDGTAIWESSKEPTSQAGQPRPQGPGWSENRPPEPPQQLGPKTSTHWDNPDADGGPWEGPPDKTNMWQGPPQSQPSNQWNQQPPQQPPTQTPKDAMWGDKPSAAGKHSPS